MLQLALTSLLVSLAAAHAVPALKYDVPPGWVALKPSSSMRVADFTLPRVAGDAEDATLTLYFFGGQGGSVQANLDRWIGQMTQPDGRASKDLAKTSTTKTAGGLEVTVVDLTGTYVAEVSPGSTQRFNKPGFRLRAAVITTPEGPYFIKLVGPAKTVEKWDGSFSAFVKSLRVG